MKLQNSKKFAVPLLLSFIVLPALLESGSAISAQREQCGNLHWDCERDFEYAQGTWTAQLCSEAITTCTSCVQACSAVTRRKVQSDYDYCSSKLRKLQNHCPH